MYVDENITRSENFPLHRNFETYFDQKTVANDRMLHF